MIPPRKTNPRAEYRLLVNQRIDQSVSLAARFPELKSLQIDLSYFEPDGFRRTGALKYTANIEHAKSVVLFGCQSADCLAGDFDLSVAVADAIAKQRKTLDGEIRCQGTRVNSSETPDDPCRKLLRYTLSLGYV
jgi:hypothetical protein